MVKASLRTKSVGTKVSDAEYAALEARARAEKARVDATKMQRARERLAAQKKANEAGR